MSPPTAYTAAPDEHRDSLPEDVEIGVSRFSVKLFQRVAAQMVAAQSPHGYVVRKVAQGLAEKYLAECERDAKAASEEEFRAWVRRRARKLRACDPRRDGWRQR
jgi:hypothetical protein